MNLFYRLKKSYQYGKMSIALAENLFWFYPQFILNSNLYAKEREICKKRFDEIKEFSKKFGCLEKIAFGLGDFLNQSPVKSFPLKEPHYF